MMRLACLFSALALAFALGACSKPPAEEPSAPEQQEAVATVEEESEAASEPESAPEAETDAAPEPEPAPAPEAEVEADAATGEEQASVAFFSIYNDEGFAEVRSFMDEEGLPAAIAYAGSLDGRTVDALLLTSYLAEAYPFVRSIPSANFAVGSGQEVFVIAPLDENATVEVVSYAESPVMGEVLYRSEVGEPIVVVCDGFCLEEDATLTVTITDGTGTYEFSPYVTTGNIPCLGEDGGDIYNFSVDMNGGPLGAQAYGDIVLYNAPDLMDQITDGMTDDPDGWTRVEVDGEPCWQIRFGTMHGDYFAAERTFAVGSESHRLYEYDVALDSWDELPAQ